MSIDDLYSYSDEALCGELFERLEKVRLSKNISQKSIADEVGITPVTYRNIKSGNAKLVTFIAVMRTLDKLEQLDNLLPDEPLSPIQLAKRQGKSRQRARGKLDVSNEINDTDQSDSKELDW
ncbi:MAG: helix-turn-helix transcriptional regulator [Gammaproteobacteria bacterium]|nr:helix-turn-helix transcriptional regulator [Gammaproteobacteria bacterium]